MKIVVLLKQTPDTETQIQLSADKKTIDHSQTKFVINPYDEYAIEEAIKLKGTHGGEVVIACFGPTTAKESILKGLAMGADRGVLVDNSSWEHADSLLIAKVLSELVKQEASDLVLCGKQAIDDDNMHVGVMLAEFLNWPHINVVTKIDLDGTTLKVEREIEGGQVEVYESKTPAVLGAHKSLNTPRYASLPGIMKAKKKPFEVKKPEDFSLTKEDLETLQQTKIDSFSYPPQKPEGKIFQGEDVEVMVDKVVNLLREEAKVL